MKSQLGVPNSGVPNSGVPEKFSDREKILYREESGYYWSTKMQFLLTQLIQFNIKRERTVTTNELMIIY